MKKPREIRPLLNNLLPSLSQLLNNQKRSRLILINSLKSRRRLLARSANLMLKKFQLSMIFTQALSSVKLKIPMRVKALLKFLE